jgi:hypothetical protein
MGPRSRCCASDSGLLVEGTIKSAIFSCERRGQEYEEGQSDRARVGSKEMRTEQHRDFLPQIHSSRPGFIYPKLQKSGAISLERVIQGSLACGAAVMKSGGYMNQCPDDAEQTLLVWVVLNTRFALVKYFRLKRQPAPVDCYRLHYSSGLLAKPAFSCELQR